MAPPKQEWKDALDPDKLRRFIAHPTILNNLFIELLLSFYFYYNAMYWMQTHKSCQINTI